MLISIISPVYNIENYIERYIASLQSQICKDFELVLVDDCGQDASIEKAKLALEKVDFPFQIIHREKNGGLSAGRNTGIAHAKGDYLYFADSDDALPADCIATIQSAISKNGAVSIYYFNADYWHTIEKKFFHFLPAIEDAQISTTQFTQKLFSFEYLAYIWMYVFSKKLFATIRFPEGAVYEDALTVPYLMSATSSVKIDLTNSIYQYFVREGSISRSVHPQLKNVIPFFEKMETDLYSVHDSSYSTFVDFRTTYLMRMSREAFSRVSDKREAVKLHNDWKQSIPLSNIKSLWQRGKRKSAIFLLISKYNPQLLKSFYQLKILK